MTSPANKARNVTSADPASTTTSPTASHSRSTSFFGSPSSTTTAAAPTSANGYYSSYLLSLALDGSVSRSYYTLRRTFLFVSKSPATIDVKPIEVIDLTNATVTSIDSVTYLPAPAGHVSDALASANNSSSTPPGMIQCYAFVLHMTHSSSEQYVLYTEDQNLQHTWVSALQTVIKNNHVPTAEYIPIADDAGEPATATDVTALSKEELQLQATIATTTTQNQQAQDAIQQLKQTKKTLIRDVQTLQQQLQLLTKHYTSTTTQLQRLKVDNDYYTSGIQSIQQLMTDTMENADEVESELKQSEVAVQDTRMRSPAPSASQRNESNGTSTSSATSSPASSTTSSPLVSPNTSAPPSAFNSPTQPVTEDTITQQFKPLQQQLRQQLNDSNDNESMQLAIEILMLNLTLRARSLQYTQSLDKLTAEKLKRFERTFEIQQQQQQTGGRRRA